MGDRARHRAFTVARGSDQDKDDTVDTGTFDVEPDGPAACGGPGAPKVQHPPPTVGGASWYVGEVMQDSGAQAEATTVNTAIFEANFECQQTDVVLDDSDLDVYDAE